MSAFRPYVDEKSFKYPLETSEKGLNPYNSSLAEDSHDSFEFLDLDEIVAGKSQLSAVGLSISRFYSRMLISQPFEVSRFLLQVGDWSDLANKSNTSQYDDYDFGEDSASSSEEDIDYFIDVRDMATTNNNNSSFTPNSTTSSTTKRKIKPSKTRDVRLFTPKTDSLFPEAINVSGGPYIFGVMGALSDKEGVFSMWRGLNASCLCHAATGVVKAWVTSFLSSSLGVPDPQFVEIIQYPDPLSIIAVGTAGCAISAALLTPLFMTRARLVSTSMTMPDKPRSLRWSLLDSVRRGQLLAPWWVMLPTTLAATVNHAFLTSVPVMLWKLWGIDTFSQPRIYQFSQLGASLVGLLIKMPLETLASRAQLKACHLSARTLIVKPVNYQGILATVWDILKGNASLSTLYHGWRSEVVGLFGEWGYNALDEGNKPTQQERF